MRGTASKNEIMWDQSSQCCGLMSIYLWGVRSSLPFNLSKHIWCPVTGIANRSICLPQDACSWRALFVCTCYIAVQGRTKEPLCQIGKVFPVSLTGGVSYCGSPSVYISHSDVSEENNSYLYLVWLPSSCPSQEKISCWVCVWAGALYSLKYVFTWTSSAWQLVLGGALIEVTPTEAKGKYLCCSRQLSLWIMSDRTT